MMHAHSGLHPDPIAAHRAALFGRAADLRQQQPAMRWCALVETGLHPSLPGILAAIGDGSAALFDDTPDQVSAASSPRLIDLHCARPGQPSPSSLIDSLLDLTRSSPCVSWLASDQGLDALAAHLRNWLDGKLIGSDGSELGEVLVRFSDPRVLPGFVDVLTPEQYGELMRPMALWAVWLRSNQWQEWTPPEDNPVRATPQTRAYTLQQQERIERSTRVDRIQALIEDQVTELEDADPMAQHVAQHFLRLPHDQRFQQLHAVLQRADRHGLRADADLQSYSWLALGIHPGFDEHDAVRQAIASAAQAGTSVSDAIAGLPDSVWDALHTQAQTAPSIQDQQGA